ncbi:MULTISPECIES: sulfurtransferase [Salipiger]|uniref:sulfurtransferase n=1 Tax=Salipiger TaxID=263377 RepID=UPI00351328FC
MNTRILGIAATATAFMTSAALAAPLGPLVTAPELDAALQSEDAPLVLDIRGEAYEEGHIEGAVSAPYGLFRGPAENPGQLVPIDQLETTYESLGLEPGEPVVIVTQGATDTEFGAAARVYWTLKSSGFTELSILNGGAQAWANAGLPVSTEAVDPQPTELSISWDDTWTADTEEVTAVVEGTGEAVLVDSRPEDFFLGKKAHGAAEKPGTLPGAVNYPYTRFFQSGATAIGQVTDATELRDALGLSGEEEVVSFCNTGHWAATNWFALSELAQLEDVKLYPGSMVEYSKTGGEMANAPGLIRNLLNQFMGSNG